MNAELHFKIGDRMFLGHFGVGIGTKPAVTQVY